MDPFSFGRLFKPLYITVYSCTTWQHIKTSAFIWLSEWTNITGLNVFLQAGDGVDLLWGTKCIIYISITWNTLYFAIIYLVCSPPVKGQKIQHRVHTPPPLKFSSLSLSLSLSLFLLLLLFEWDAEFDIMINLFLCY
jgi:hypothetical protein